ncbi:hypothetical protein ACFVYE_13045 [Streptomyces sp. NPDC058239]|uniref:hypothetical protein n=1 Tax=Streptomyces sp. NPDC058239 TaxID=3346395 RepID=UPI0036E327B8
MRLIVREERPHFGTQLRFTDADGLRLTRFATSTCDSPTTGTGPTSSPARSSDSTPSRTPVYRQTHLPRRA